MSNERVRIDVQFGLKRIVPELISNMTINDSLYSAPDISLIKKYEFTDYQKALMELDEEFPGTKDMF